MKYGDGVGNKGPVNFEEPQEKGERWVGSENLAYVVHYWAVHKGVFYVHEAWHSPHTLAHYGRRSGFPYYRPDNPRGRGPPYSAT